MMAESIGSYLCENCGKMEIHNPESILVIFPKALEPPVARITCTKCGAQISSEISWDDAIIFDRSGARVEGYSFARGKPPTEDEISSFMARFDQEMVGFLEACKSSKKR